jgi:hypothetical protein
MKLTLKQLVDGYPALTNFGKEKLVGKLAYSLSKNLSAVTAEMVAYEKGRNTLVEKYGKEDAEGNVTVLPENIKSFLKELEAFQSEETDIFIRPIVLPAYSTYISAADMFLLEWMVTVEGEN